MHDKDFLNYRTTPSGWGTTHKRMRKSIRVMKMLKITKIERTKRKRTLTEKDNEQENISENTIMI